MCSVEDDPIEEEGACKFMPLQSSTAVKNPICNKCGGKDTKVVLRRLHAYCRDCFLAGTTHKFKALIGKHRLIAPNDRILICVNGDHASTALLHLFHKGIAGESAKKLNCRPVAICVHGEIAEENRAIMQRIKDEAEGYGFGFYFVSQPEYVEKNQKQGGDEIGFGNFLKKDVADLSQITFKSRRDINETNNQNILHIYRQKLLRDAAKYLSCKCVFTTEISSDIASQLLTNVSLGRGAQIPFDTGICDARDEEIKIARPLRLFEMKELVFYNVFNNLKPNVFDQTTQTTKNSVQGLMRAFVTNLQDNYPATITTVMRVGDKLVASEGGKKCKFCGAPVESENRELSSSESTNFSRWTSSSREETFNNKSAQGDYCVSCSKIVGEIT